MGSEWPMWRHNPGRTGGDGTTVYPPLKPIWQFQPKGAIVDSLAVAGDLVCFGSKDKNLYALDAANGSQRWIQSLHMSATSGPVIAHGQVLCCNGYDNLYAFDQENGQQKWRYEVRSVLSPAVGDGKVFVCDNHNSLHCLRSDDGEKLWVTELKKSFMSIVGTPPVYVNGEVLLGGKKLRRIDATSGKVIQEAGRLDNIACVSTAGGVCGRKGGDVIGALLDNLDAMTWELKGSAPWITADERQIYMLSYRRSVETLPTESDTTSGWQAFIGPNLSTGLSDSAYALAGPVLYVGTKEPAFHAIWVEPTSIMRRWKQNLVRNPESMSVGGGRLFIGDDDNELTAFEGVSRSEYEGQFSVGESLHLQPTLEAAVLRPPSARASDAAGPVRAIAGGAQLGILKASLQLDYRGNQATLKVRPGLSKLQPAVWPDCCSMCCQPATTHRPLAEAKHYQVPYCSNCDGRIKSGQEAPAVTAQLQHRDSLELLSFRNEHYWKLFMTQNNLK